MRKSFSTLDQILRGDATKPSALRTGTMETPTTGLGIVVLTLGLSYGFCMGWYALFNHPREGLMQMFASTIKVPTLFVLTLLVTFPSLYVFNALVGSRLSMIALARLLVSSMGVTLAVLASLGPITAFFSVTTTSYPFMVAFNVFLFGTSGLLGVFFLLQTLNRLSHIWILQESQPSSPAPSFAETPAASVDAAASSESPPPPHPLQWPKSENLGALERFDGRLFGPRVKEVFHAWVLIFSVVGCQMSWVLRPFIGAPDQPFAWFRPRESHFLASIVSTLSSLLGADMR